LDILRKIFNLDKYKKIRENLYFYLKKLRIQSTVLKTKIEPLEQKKNNLTELREQQERFQGNLEKLQPELKLVQAGIEKKKTELLELEQKNQLHLEIKNQLKNNFNLLTEKQESQNNLSEKQKRLIEKLAQITTSKTKEKIKQDLDSLQKQKQNFVTKESEVKTKINHCQEQVARLQKEISQLNEQTQTILEKQKLLRELKEAVLDKEKIKTEKENLETGLEKIKKALQEKKILFSQAQEIKQKISQLDECPTCLQSVPTEYKQGVFSKQEKIISTAKEKAEQLEKEKTAKQQNFRDLNQQFDSLLKKENLLVKTQTEVDTLKEKQELLGLKKDGLQKLVIENNQLIKSLEELKPEKLEELNKSLGEKQEELQKVVQKQELEQNKKELLDQIGLNQEKIKQLGVEKTELGEKLVLNPDLTEKIEQQKKTVEECLEKEKNLLTERIKLITQTENLQQQIKELIAEVDQLNEDKTHLQKITKITYWLNEFLIKLTYTIEKQVMVKIHYLFNSLFREWFAILMEDENFSARLDDSFTPVIEQNGYEIYFNNLSGGERTAASLSYRLALNKVINDVVYEIKTKDLLILDEPTDGFSSEQLDKVRDVLERLNLKQTLVVSHENKIESFVENVIRINKEEGVSLVI